MLAFKPFVYSVCTCWAEGALALQSSSWAYVCSDFLLANSQFNCLGFFCAQSVMSCPSTNGSSEHQVPVTKATSHSRFLPEGYPPSPIIQLFFYYFVSASSLIIQNQESLLYSYGEELQVWQCQDTGEACWQICWVSLLWTLNDFSWIKIIDLVILKKIYY